MPTVTAPSDAPAAPEDASSPHVSTAAGSLTELTYLRLRRDIIEGRHPPGEKLRVEHLKDVYQVSSGTLREALALLVSDSLVINQAQRGFRVAPMSLDDLRDITHTRTLLECAALRESITCGDDEWETRVVSSYHKLSLAEARLINNAAGVFADWEQRNQEFHEALISACTSQWTLRFRALLYQQSRRYRWLSAVQTEVSSTVHEQHQAIFEASLGRDVERADQLLTEHLGLTLLGIVDKRLLK